MTESGALRTRRLTLEPARLADAKELAVALDDPALHEFIGGAPLSAAGWRSRLRAWTRGRSADGSEQWRNWVVRRRATGSMIGYVQATITAEEVDIAYVIGTPSQRHGYAKEATAAMLGYLRTTAQPKRIVAWVAPGHRASEAVAAAVGLGPSGRFDESGEQAWTLEFPPDAADESAPKRD